MENHFLIKRNEGEILHIYHMKGNGICIQSIRTPGNAEVLLKNGFHDFDCWYDDKKDDIHIVCQNSEGSINHLLCREGAWKKKELLTGKLKLPYPKYFHILPVEDQLMFFYVIRHDGMLLLVSQWLGGKEMPLVVGYVSDEHQKFIASIKSGKPCVIYINSEGQTEQKVFDEKHWQTRALLLDLKGEIPLKEYLDTRGNEHLITCKKEKGETEYFYRIKSKKIWSEKTRIFHSKEAPTDVLFSFDENIPTFVIFNRSEIRVFSMKNRMWEGSPVKERLVHRLKKATKITLLSGRREETVGGFEQGRVDLVLKKSFLLPRESLTISANPEKNNMEDKILELEKIVKGLESKIASLQELHKKD